MKGELTLKKDNLCKLIDHTILKPEATSKDIEKICKEAKEYNFASVCINPGFVSYAKKLLEESEVKVCTVVGFPLGATTTNVKVFETNEAIENGAEEIDMVINVGKLKEEDFDYVRNDIKAVVEASKEKAIVKVIIETILLTDKEKQIACRLSKEAGADFVKTSTGFLGGGATVEDVKLMKEEVGDDVKVKASGGVKNYNDALDMINAGANRLGTSKSIDIVSNLE